MLEPGGGGRGATALAPPIFDSTVNPILTEGGQIMPTNYHWPPQSFSPSGITACTEHVIILDDVIVFLPNCSKESSALFTVIWIVE